LRDQQIEFLRLLFHSCYPRSREAPRVGERSINAGCEGFPSRFGPYVLVSLLGEGGMARVYRAVRRGPLGFRKEVALKRIRTDLTRGDEALVHALVNEARLGGQLRHPNIVDTYEFGLVDGQYYISMEFVNGWTLQSLVAGATQRGTRLPVGAVLDMAMQICDGLEYAHDLRSAEGASLALVHRDLKPANIIVSQAGQAKIMDFGIARSTSALFRTTSDHTVKGTLSYMSPEQLSDPANLDRRSDLFALGAIVFETLCGETLIQGSVMQNVIWQITTGKFLSRLDLAEDVLPGSRLVLERCLQIDRESRYPDASELRAALDELRVRSGDELGCRELAGLIDAAATEDSGRFQSIREHIESRAEGSAASSSWPGFVGAAELVPEDETDWFRAGIHPPVSSLSGEHRSVMDKTTAGDHEATVVWQASDATMATQDAAVQTGLPRWGRRRAGWIAVVLLVLIAGLGIYSLSQLGDRGVGTMESPAPPVGPAAAEEPLRGGVLRVGAATALPTLDPLVSDVSEGQMAICRLLYDTLVTLDWTGEVQPLLATSWTVEDGQRTFTFDLRRDVQFHDDPCFEDGEGRLLVAGDVKASLERVIAYVVTYEGHPLADMPRIVGTDALLAGEAEHLAGVETPDDHTVVVRFERPATEFLHTLSWLPWSVVAAEALQQYAEDEDLGRHVVGTGPYRVSTEGEGADVTLVPHDDAWQRDPDGRQLPFPDRIEVHAYQGPIAAATSLKEGRIDLLMGAGESLRDELFEVAGGKAVPRQGWEILQAGGYLDDAMREQRVMLLDARSESPVVADVRIRRAIGLALRRGELATADSFPTDSPLVDAMLGYQPRVGADPERARTLLEEAGYTGGEGWPSLTLCGTASFHDAMSTIKDHLHAVGIESTVIDAEPRAMHRYFTEGGCDALMLAMMGLVVNDDPLEYMISYASMIQLEQRVEDFPEFIERARAEGDPERRAELGIEMAKLIEEDAMLVVLAQRRPGIPDYAFIASPRVGGLNDPRTGLMNPLRERLHQLWVRPSEP